MDQTSEDKTIAMLCHLLGIFTMFVGPLIVWLLKRESSPFVDDQGKEALNFQLTVLISYTIGAATTCFLVGFFILTATWVASVILSILAAVAANQGTAYRYPFAIRLIK